MMYQLFVGLVAAGLFIGLGLMTQRNPNGVYLAAGSVLVGMIGGTIISLGV